MHVFTHLHHPLRRSEHLRVAPVGLQMSAALVCPPLPLHPSLHPSIPFCLSLTSLLRPPPPLHLLFHFVSSVTPTLSFRLDCLQVFLIFLLIPPPLSVSLSPLSPVFSSPDSYHSSLCSQPSWPASKRERVVLSTFLLSLTHQHKCIHSLRSG